MASWQWIRDVFQLNAAVEMRLDAPVLAVDTETTGLNPHLDRLRLVQVAADGFETLVIDCFEVLPDGKEALNRLMSAEGVKVFQNAKFDLKFLRSEGIEVRGKLFDTMLAGQLLRSSGGTKNIGLGGLAEFYLDRYLAKDEQTSDFSGDLREGQLAYAAKDAEILLPLRKVMIDKLQQNRLIEVARLEFACVYAVAAMEYDGIHVDLDRLNKLTHKIEKAQTEALESLYSYTGRPTVQLGLFDEKVTSSFNFNSNKQVLELLRENGIEVKNTSRFVLAPYLTHPLVKFLLDYRHANKALTGFLYPVPELINPKTGRLHPSYGQNGAYSGRMSAGNPNIQAIPRGADFRDCFTAPEGRKLVIADYSQIELRVIAQFTGDPRMVEAYKKGEDLHKLTASLILDKPISDITKAERQSAKAVNFGLVYGMGAAGLKAYASDTYGSEMTMEEAELFKKRYFQAYKGVDHWHRTIKRTLPGESRTLSGRKHIYAEDSGMAGRYNTPIQGTGADILKNALGMLYIRLKDHDTQIVAVVHDEIVLECPQEKAEMIGNLLETTMEEAGARYMKNVPTVAEAAIADSWAGKS